MIVIKPNTIDAKKHDSLLPMSSRPFVQVVKKVRRSSKPIESPFVICIDSAEQLPFEFKTLHADAVHLYRPLVVRTIRRHLPIANTRLSIDYSIDGFEHLVGIERKSHEDFCNTLAGRHRDRFEKKLAIINDTFQHFTVVVEAEWSTILYQPPDFSSVVPKTLFRTVVAWQQRYQRVHWLLLPNRRLAEMATYRVLERWWKEQKQQDAPIQNERTLQCQKRA